jgi:hypothetical protein
MATTSDAGMLAGSNIVTGAGTASRSFTLPGSPLYIVQSVVATVDNAAGADTTATLTFADTNGEVIAKRTQGDVIPAGGSGTATFALRLAGNSNGTIRFNRVNRGGGLSIRATGTGSSPTANLSLAALGQATIYSGVNLDSGATSEQDINLIAGGGLFLSMNNAATTDAFALQNHGPDGITNLTLLRISPTSDSFVEVPPNKSFQVRNHSDQVVFQANDDNSVQVFLAAGTALKVHAAGGAQIFRVDENGDLHGKTGKALVFDL